MSRYRLQRWLFAIALALSLVLPACQQWGIPFSQSTVILTGSSTVAPLMAEIADRYRITHPQVDIQIATGGSNQGITDVATGVADIGMASRRLTPQEAEDLQVSTVALDGISILVHRSNPIDQLSAVQVQQIYRGQIDQWQDLEGQDLEGFEAPITVVSKTQKHATFDVFVDYFDLQPDQIQANTVVGDNQEMIQTVLDNPDAIGYVSIGAAEYEIVRGLPLKLLPLSGVKATIANVQQGQFPLSRPLNLVTRSSLNETAQALIDYALSEGVHDLIEQQAFVPVRAER